VATAPNLGTGGSVLDAQFGSSSTSNTNEPLALAHTDTNYLYLPGVSGNYASIPDSAALDITGDIDIRVRVALDDWTPSTGNTLVNKANGAANDFAYYLEVGSTGALRFRYSADGTTRLDRLSTASVPFADGSIGWVRVTLDVDNGAGSNVVSFFTAADSSTMPSSWTALGTAVTTAGTTSIFASGQPLQLGGQNSGLAVNLSGKLYYVQILNGIGGTVVLDADFTTGITSGGQTSFVESSSNAATVTINRSTSGRKAVAVVRPVWLLGTDDYFEVADNDLLDFTNTEDLSAVAIVRAWGTTADDTLIAKKAGTTSASAGWMLDMGTSSVTQARISDGTTQHAPTAGTRTAGALSLLAAVKSGSTITSYLGSTAGTPVTITATGTYANSEVMRIGRLSGAGTSYADVELLAAMVFRRALSATELAAIATYYGI
jgi:hypothetical protein